LYYQLKFNTLKTQINEFIFKKEYYSKYKDFTYITHISFYMNDIY